ncbi:hypothetical protein Mnod_3120 [Methylobacterium nodulans ORS 2060]|uniref:Uncharacterized protein n=1 Tax=Methylobacterium nodulans (strain LMG 21967 / CNCM I-2342 / ORS 2060) TaxID=460265 RepID=B8IJK5_METNO|nr:hypothetical protein Mnod_3120 [Methylobacterium nodulans ORS 2060]
MKLFSGTRAPAIAAVMPMTIAGQLSKDTPEPEHAVAVGRCP